MPNPGTFVTVLNRNPNIDIRRQPMFFGERSGIVRTDHVRYPSFVRLTEEQYANYWRPHDIHITKDKIDFAGLSKAAQHVWLNNLAYQQLLDSQQSRAILEALLSWVSNPELESCIKVWAFFEEIHNKSYEYIIKNLFPDPTPFIDGILRNTAIMKRADAITKHYDNFMSYSYAVQHAGYVDGRTRREHKRLLYRAIVAIYVLEGLRFYVSFTCTFAIAQQDVMLNSATHIKLIARDENLHVGITLNILRKWPTDDPEMAEIAAEERGTVLAIFDEATTQEIEWSEYLLSEGQLLGVTAPLMAESVQARANQRLAAIGFERRYSARHDPFSRWMSNWTETANEQTAPQEKELDSYKVSALNREIDHSKLMDDF